MTNDMTSGILETIKAMLGGPVDLLDESFDTELLVHINSVISTLNQIGVGKEGFYITQDEIWSDLFENDVDAVKFQQVKTYIYIEVKKLFDPPASATVANALEAKSKELEWRLYSLANY